jgi:hypothetical protein
LCLVLYMWRGPHFSSIVQLCNTVSCLLYSYILGAAAYALKGLNLKSCDKCRSHQISSFFCQSSSQFARTNLILCLNILNFFIISTIVLCCFHFLKLNPLSDKLWYTWLHGNLFLWVLNKWPSWMHFLSFLPYERFNCERINSDVKIKNWASRAFTHYQIDHNMYIDCTNEFSSYWEVALYTQTKHVVHYVRSIATFPSLLKQNIQICSEENYHAIAQFKCGRVLWCDELFA